MSNEDVFLGLLATLALSVSFAIFQALRVARLRDQLQKPLPGLPAELRVAWQCGTARNSSNNPHAAELSTIQILYQLSRLDRDPLRTWRPTHLPQDVAELLTQLSATAPSSEKAQFGAQRQGEQLLAERLREDGHDVALLEPKEHTVKAAPGWPALVDGCDVMLLASLLVDDIHDFLERAPQSTVVTIGDHATEFVNSARVVALSQVTAESLTPQSTLHPPLDPSLDTTEKAATTVETRPVSALSGLGTLVAAHALPPLLLSAIEGAQKAARGDPQWLATTSSQMTDGAASSVGGWAGARAGALAGALLGPAGMAAGGFLGSLLGKKVGEGLASGYRERELRKLIALQDQILARLPLVACTSLAKKAEHLANVEREIVEFDRGFSIWPTLGRVARRDVAHIYGKDGKNCRRRSKDLKRWLNERRSTATKATRGRALLAQGHLGWSSELLRIHMELELLTKRINLEHKKQEKLIL